MKILYWIGAYFAASMISWAIDLYQIGKHRGEHHNGEWSGTCKDFNCESSSFSQALSFFLWPILIIAYPFVWWHDLWMDGGTNSILPPTNSILEKEKDVS